MNNPSLYLYCFQPTYSLYLSVSNNPPIFDNNPYLLTYLCTNLPASITYSIDYLPHLGNAPHLQQRSVERTGRLPIERGDELLDGRDTDSKAFKHTCSRNAL